MNNNTEKIRGLLTKNVARTKVGRVVLTTEDYDQALSLLPPPKVKVFNCRHFRFYSQSVPMPFGSGNCSEPLGDCAIESESEDCCLECPDYEEAKPCSTCKGAAICIHNGKANSQFAQDCIDSGYKSYRSPDRKACGGSGEVWSADEFGLREEPGCMIPCPDCPTGEVEEYKEILGDDYDKFAAIPSMKKVFLKLQTHLTALLKQIAVQDEDITGFQDDLLKANKQVEQLESKKHITLTQAREMALFSAERSRQRTEWENTKEANKELEAKTKDLEDGAFAANEEAQIKGDQIKQLEAENRWIPVSERLPELYDCPHPHSSDVLLALSEVYLGWFEKDRGWRHGDGTVEVFPTHWKPIILPQKKEE